MYNDMVTFLKTIEDDVNGGDYAGAFTAAGDMVTEFGTVIFGKKAAVAATATPTAAEKAAVVAAATAAKAAIDNHPQAKTTVAAFGGSIDWASILSAIIAALMANIGKLP